MVFRKIKIAFQIRKPLLQTETNSYRFIYGENDGLPGLIADVYNNTLVVKLYSAIWYPYFETILPLLIAICKCDTAVLRLSRSLQSAESEYQYSDGQVVFGKLEDEVVIFKEHGLRFSANVIHGHKTGYFLDHRHNRKRVGQMAKGKSVLDVFAYAGGFSVHALVGGARDVTSIDISAKALEMAAENASLNLHKGKHVTLAVDAFKGLESLRAEGKYF